MKPEIAFYERVGTSLGLPPDQLFLVDDSLKNIQAARACGWQGYHFTNDYEGLCSALLEAHENQRADNGFYRKSHANRHMSIKESL